MKKVVLFQLIMVFVAFGCTQAEIPGDVEAEDYKSYLLDAYLDSLIADSAVVAADTAEINNLLFMREEEKLAHDVYITLYDKWGFRVFNNISNSEQRHTEAVLTLLDYYGIEDVVNDNPLGVFVNGDLQALYDTLVDKGSISEIEALKVGALIEEVDIADLEKELALTDKDPIITVYSNLLMGSENHLRAFVRNLNRWGVVYEPQVLDTDAYNSIIFGD
ncbi:DUF2202 domain-containing protein [Saccharicrinis sp. FJH54]|uniref:DUF2202 domain-containing protein n=1 Tax=Saccharicrinis sp. FJH54 TaxID=3344665 RepID=UPI0035D4CB6C